MKYPLENLNYEEFEKLVALICSEILGIGTIVFSQGADGGRDAKFTGKANSFPSESSPWEGKFIVQAKHTHNLEGSCTDPDFKRLLQRELPKIKKLKEDGKLDYYLLFTNRKLSGLQDAKIEDFIGYEVGIKNCVIANETIHLFLDKYPHISKSAGLHKLLISMDFYEEDIRDIIVAFSESKFNSQKLIESNDPDSTFELLKMEKKNELNNLSQEYFTNIITSSYSHFEQIEKFLQDPINADYKEKYDNTVLDLQEQIILRRNDYDSIENMLNQFFKLILDKSNSKLLEKRSLIRIFLHFMYTSCDIGKKE